MPLNNTTIYTAMGILTGLLLWLAWPPNGVPVLFLVAWVPLLWVEDTISRTSPTRSRLRLWGHSYLAFFVWNTLTTWWIWNATPEGAIFAILANSLLMCIPFLAFHITKQQLGARIGYTSLILYWLSFEYFHHQWELSWPWLTLGNGLAEVPALIQWYTYTGTAGGTLWIWLINIVVLHELSNFARYRELLAQRIQARPGKLNILSLLLTLLKPGLAVLIPVVLSLYSYYNYSPEGKPAEVVVVQPNVDPYGEKFKSLSPQKQLRRLMNLSEKALTAGTDYLVWPETAIVQALWVQEIEQSRVIDTLNRFLKQYPNTYLVSGFNGYRQYKNRKEASATARTYDDGKCCYDAHNAALQLSPSGKVDYYYKSKLVPGVERIPYPAFFRFLEPLAIDMGGIVGSLGMQAERSVFNHARQFKVAPVICYESIYGEYLTEYIHLGANLIFIVTNDGWWGNTYGYKQHLLYGRLRAIETRRSIARAANTGISCFIDQRGNIHQSTVYWEQAVIRQTIHANKASTFYTRMGDYMGRISAFLAVILLCVTFVSYQTEKFRYRL